MRWRGQLAFDLPSKEKIHKVQHYEAPFLVELQPAAQKLLNSRSGKCTLLGFWRRARFWSSQRQGGRRLTSSGGCGRYRPNAGRMASRFPIEHLCQTKPSNFWSQLSLKTILCLSGWLGGGKHGQGHSAHTSCWNYRQRRHYARMSKHFQRPVCRKRHQWSDI